MLVLVRLNTLLLESDDSATEVISKVLRSMASSNVNPSVELALSNVKDASFGLVVSGVNVVTITLPVVPAN